MSLKHGGNAFPVGGHGEAHRIGAEAIQGITDPDERDRVYIAVAAQAAQGMTLRDYFAAKAMQGYLANPWQAKELDETGDSSTEQMRIVAEISYAMADAMLVAREVQS